MRELTPTRRLSYFILKPIAKMLIQIMWWSCKIETIDGEDDILKISDEGGSIIPCYWHQRQIFCGYYLVNHLKKHFKTGILVSPSVDGEVPSQILQSWGLRVIRGSATRTGARAMRDLYQIVKDEGVSPAATPDGPKGPIYEFKSGMVMLAQLTQLPIVPLTYGVDRFWTLKTWDHFIIPKPFARVCILVGKPNFISRKASTAEQETLRLDIEKQMNDLMDKADNSFN